MTKSKSKQTEGDAIASLSVNLHAGNTGNAPSYGMIEQEFRKVFDALDTESRGKVRLSSLKRALWDMGIHERDPRVNAAFKGIQQGRFDDEYELDFDAFCILLKGAKGSLVSDAIQGNLIIPDFNGFRKTIDEIFERVKLITQGEVANYIPQLSRVNPEKYAVAVCTSDGQQHSMGDSREFFCVQSICKPINYCLALEEHGEKFVHKHVGREPSGISFNSLTLNKQGLPHNPLINAGAIMTCAMIRPKLEMADRFDYVLDTWTRLSGGHPARFNNAVYLSERQTADRNFALGYFMKENKAFPENTNLIETLEFYFQCCSIEVNAENLAVVAATLANGGICPLSGERILKPDTVKNCLSLMYSCGMYDFSGEFSFIVGLPAKSGVSGGLMVVVPNLLGLVIWSPRLDDHGNSVRGIEFCKQLVDYFNFHNYDSLLQADSYKKDPRQNKNAGKVEGVVRLCFAASANDLQEIKQLLARGVDINDADYDGRTALHLAASEGHLKIVAYLLAHGAKPNPVDRWGNTPLDDARRGNHIEIIEYLTQNDIP